MNESMKLFVEIVAFLTFLLQVGVMKIVCHISKKHKLTVTEEMIIEVMMVHFMLQGTRDWENLIKHGSKLVSKQVQVKAIK